MKSLLAIVIVELLCFVTGAAAESLMTFHPEQPVRLEAEELHGSYADNRFEAIGAATLVQGGMTLHADRIWFDKEKNEAGANGNVQLVEESGTIAGHDLHLYLDTETARLNRAKAYLSGQGFHLSGATIEKLGENRYRITDGDFTACLDDPPAWKFGARTVDIEVGGYARAQHMIFYLHDVPVFYLPYFLYPVKTERESGLLIPHFGYSRLRGVEVALAYYQVLGRNMDATLLLDSYSRAGLGKGLEYRYLLGEKNNGTSSIYHVSGFGERKDVYAATWQHAGQLPGKIQFHTDLEYVSDRSYLQDFTPAAKDYNRELVESYVYLSRAWGKVDLSIQGEYVKDLSEETIESPLSRLPETHLAVIPQRIGETPFYLRLDVEGNNIQRGSQTIGQTLLIHPGIRAALMPLPGISFDLDWGYRSFLTQTSDSSDYLGFYDISAKLATRLQRIYANAHGSWALRHDIEPEIGYLRVADRNQTTFPQLIPDDTFLPVDRLTVALGNRLTSRSFDAQGNAEIRERLWLRFSTGYNLSDAPENPESFEPLRGELSLTPADWLALRSDARYGLEAGKHYWETVMSGIRLRDGRRDELIVDYYYRDGNEADFIASRLNTPLGAHLFFGYETRFSANGSRFLEHLADLEYRGQCWSVIFTYHERPDDREYLVNFTLAGLGANSTPSSRMSGTTGYAGSRR